MHSNIKHSNIKNHKTWCCMGRKGGRGRLLKLLIGTTNYWAVYHLWWRVSVQNVQNFVLAFWQSTTFSILCTVGMCETQIWNKMAK